MVTRAEVEAAKALITGQKEQVATSRESIKEQLRGLKPKKRVPFTTRSQRVAKTKIRRQLTSREKQLRKAQEELTSQEKKVEEVSKAIAKSDAQYQAYKNWVKKAQRTQKKYGFTPSTIPKELIGTPYEKEIRYIIDTGQRAEVKYNQAIKEFEESLPKGEKIVYNESGEPVGVESGYLQQSIDIGEYQKEIERIQKLAPIEKYLDPTTGKIYDNPQYFGKTKVLPKPTYRVLVNPKTNKPIQNIQRYFEEKNIPKARGTMTAEGFRTLIERGPALDIMNLEQIRKREEISGEPIAYYKGGKKLDPKNWWDRIQIDRIKMQEKRAKEAGKIEKATSLFTTPEGVREIFTFGGKLTRKAGTIIAKPFEATLKKIGVPANSWLFKPLKIGNYTMSARDFDNLVGSVYLGVGFGPLMETATAQQVSAYADEVVEVTIKGQKTRVLRSDLIRAAKAGDKEALKALKQSGNIPPMTQEQAISTWNRMWRSEQQKAVFKSFIKDGNKIKIYTTRDALLKDISKWKAFMKAAGMTPDQIDDRLALVYKAFPQIAPKVVTQSTVGGVSPQLVQKLQVAQLEGVGSAVGLAGGLNVAQAGETAWAQDLLVGVSQAQLSRTRQIQRTQSRTQQLTRNDVALNIAQLLAQDTTQDKAQTTAQMPQTRQVPRQLQPPAFPIPNLLKPTTGQPTGPPRRPAPPRPEPPQPPSEGGNPFRFLLPDFDKRKPRKVKKKKKKKKKKKREVLPTLTQQIIGYKGKKPIRKVTGFEAIRII